MTGLSMPFYILRNIHWLPVASPPVMENTDWFPLSLNTLNQNVQDGSLVTSMHPEPKDETEANSGLPERTSPWMKAFTHRDLLFPLQLCCGVLWQKHSWNNTQQQGSPQSAHNHSAG